MKLNRYIFGIILIIGIPVILQTRAAASNRVSNLKWLEMCYVMARKYGIPPNEVEHISRSSLTVEPIVLAKGITTYKATGESHPFAVSRRTYCIIRVQESNEKAIIADIGPADHVTVDKLHSHGGYYDLVILRTDGRLDHPQKHRMTYQGDRGDKMTGEYRYSN